MIELQTRYNFTFNFLVGAAALTKMAIQINNKGVEATETEYFEYKSFVAGSIMQSVAALESEAWSILNHGPGHHLGSNGLDNEAKEILSIIADSLEKEPILDRYNLILQLTKRKKLDLGAQPMQDLRLLIGLRNEITHFKSLLTKEMDNKKLLNALEEKDSTRPSFFPQGHMNFFPHICLNHIRAKWAVDTAVAFIDYYYKEMEIKSPIEGQNRQHITI